MTDSNERGTQRLKVTEAAAKDLGHGLLRMDPADMQKLKVKIGDVVEVAGKRKSVGKVMPVHKELRGQSRVLMDGILRENAGVGLDDHVQLCPVKAGVAERLVVSPLGPVPSERDMNYIGSLLDGLPVTKGDRLRATLFGRRSADFRVVSTAPQGPVVIVSTTRLVVDRTEAKEETGRISYEDIGGLKPQLQRIREMIELPLRFPEVFERLGIDPPKGVLLHGPPGCGKTLIARAIAQETEANFFSVSGPEVIHKFYGESEAHLRKLFEQAAAKGPSIIFLDEIDAIAPHREKVVGDVEKRVVATLLALMDGLNRRQNIVVIAATNIPNAIDPALRRPGRFDREIAIPIPDRPGRNQILEVHSSGMPLAVDVDLAHLAGITHGFVGADIEALCREAAMRCLRRNMDDLDFEATAIPIERLASLEVVMEDFLDAFREIEPSAIREVFVDVPDVRWSDVGGLEPVKTELVEAVEWPLTHPELFARAGVRPPKGILLSGPPGCGKTLLARAVATESGVNFISIKGPALLSMYVGESERGVRDVFRKARQAAPCIVFFDEVDSLLPRRGAGGFDSHVAERVLSQFLAEFDGVDDLTGVLVLAATNRMDMLDPAVLRPGRFDVCIEIPLPDVKAAAQILRIHLKGKPVMPDVDIDNLAAACVGMNGAEIRAVCQSAAMELVRKAVRASLGGGEAEWSFPPLSRDALEAAVRQVARRREL